MVLSILSDSKNEELNASLCIRLPQIIRYVRNFDNAKTMGEVPKEGSPCVCVSINNSD